MRRVGSVATTVLPRRFVAPRFGQRLLADARSRCRWDLFEDVLDLDGIAHSDLFDGRQEGRFIGRVELKHLGVVKRNDSHGRAFGKWVALEDNSATDDLAGCDSHGYSIAPNDSNVEAQPRAHVSRSIMWSIRTPSPLTLRLSSRRKAFGRGWERHAGLLGPLVMPSPVDHHASNVTLSISLKCSSRLAKAIAC